MRFGSPCFFAGFVVLLAAIPAPAAPQTQQPHAVNCQKLSVNGSNIVAGSTLTVTINGSAVSTYDQAASGELGPLMQPGLNVVGLSFAAPGEPGPFGTQAELRCLPPNVGSSRNDILRLQPTSKRLSAEVRVNYVPQ